MKKEIVKIGEVEREIIIPSGPKPIRVVIDRKKWFRGKGGDDSRLLTMDGEMCCLGFDALRLGFKAEDIEGKCDGAEMDVKVPGLSSKQDGVFRNTKTASDMININDDMEITDAVREVKLKKLARRIGRRFVFRG